MFVAMSARKYDSGNRTYYCRYSTNRAGNTTMGIGHITAVIVLTGNMTMGIGHITAVIVLTGNTTMGIGHEVRSYEKY